MTAAITLDPDVPGFLPSSPIRGTVEWISDAPVASLELRLLYHTSGAGTQDVRTVAVEKFPAAGASDKRAFELRCPAGSPWSFSGKKISLQWSLELVEGEDVLVANRDLVISPTGAELDLYAHAGGNPGPSR